MPIVYSLLKIFSSVNIVSSSMHFISSASTSSGSVTFLFHFNLYHLRKTVQLYFSRMFAGISLIFSRLEAPKYFALKLAMLIYLLKMSIETTNSEFFCIFDFYSSSAFRVDFSPEQKSIFALSNCWPVRGYYL